MEWAVIVLVVLAILFAIRKVGHAVLFGVGSPHVVHAEIKDALRRIQLAASENVGSSPAEGSVPGVPPTVAVRQTAVVRGAVRFVYAIDRDENGVSHVVTSQLQSHLAEEFQTQCMMMVILLLTRQLGDAGFDPKEAGFDLDEVTSGTHVVTMHLTPEQHDALLRTELKSPDAA